MPFFLSCKSLSNGANQTSVPCKGKTMQLIFIKRAKINGKTPLRCWTIENRSNFHKEIIWQEHSFFSMVQIQIITGFFIATEYHLLNFITAFYPRVYSKSDSTNPLILNVYTVKVWCTNSVFFFISKNPSCM